MEDIKPQDLDGRFKQDIINWKKHVTATDLNLEEVATSQKQLVEYLDIYSKIKKLLQFHKILIEQTSTNWIVKFHVGKLATLFDEVFRKNYGKQLILLPHGQVIEIWTFILDNFDVNNVILLILFSQFLCHIKCGEDLIPIYLKSDFNLLLDKTIECLKKSTEFLNKAEFLYQKELLLLYNSWGSTIFLKLVYVNDEEKDKQLIDVNAEWFDLTCLHDYFDVKTLGQFLKNAKNLETPIKSLALKLLIQKIQFIKAVGLQLNDSSLLNVASRDLATIITEYGEDLDVWTCQELCAIFQFLDEKQIEKFCKSFINFQINHGYLSKEVDLFARSDVFLENIKCQTAFVDSIFYEIYRSFKKRKLEKEDSKSLTKMKSIIFSLSDFKAHELINTTPLNSKLNEMWKFFSNISKQVEMIEEREKLRNTEHLTSLTNLLNYLPLEFLSPGNQMKCLLGMTSILFSFTFEMEMESEVKLLNVIFDNLIRIFNGVRSIWFFNFIDPANFFVKIVFYLNKLDFEKSKHLISIIIGNLFYKFKSIDELKEIVKLISHQDFQTKTSFHINLMIETLLLKNFIKLSNKKSYLKKTDNLEEAVHFEANQIAVNIFSRIKSYIKNIEKLDLSDSSFAIVESFTIVFKYHILKLNKEAGAQVKSKWKKILHKLIDISLEQLRSQMINSSCFAFLTLLCTNRNTLIEVLPESFIEDLWKAILPTIKSRQVPIFIDFDKETFSLASEQQEKDRKIYGEFLENRSFILNKKKEEFLENNTVCKLYSERILTLVIEFYRCTSESEFQEIIRKLLTKFQKSHYNNCAVLITAWKGVFTFNFHTEGSKPVFVNEILTNLLIEIARLLNECGEDCNSNVEEVQVNVAVPLLELVSLILRESKKMIGREQLFLSLQCNSEVHLKNFVSNINVFILLFQSMYSILNETLLKHKFIMLDMMSTFNLFVQNLLSSLILVSEQDLFMNFDPSIKHRLELCAQNMDRLLTLLASFDEDFVSVAPHLIAFYVIQTQSVTIHQSIRKHLLSGVYRLLKLVNQEGVEMIHSRLNQSSREIFKMLYETFDKYYKFKGEI